MVPYKCFKMQLVLFLGFTYLLSSSAVPATRSLKINDEGFLSQNFQQDERVLNLGVRYVERRVDLETMDYSEVGANPEHDPKPPGRA